MKPFSVCLCSRRRFAYKCSKNINRSLVTCREITCSLSLYWYEAVWGDDNTQSSQKSASKSFIMSCCCLDCGNADSSLQEPVTWWSVSPHVTEHVSIPRSACGFHPSFHSADLCLAHVMNVHQAMWQGGATEPLGGRADRSWMMMPEQLIFCPRLKALQENKGGRRSSTGGWSI